MPGFSPLLEAPSVSDLVGAMDRTVSGLERIKERLALQLHRHVAAALAGHGHRPPNLVLVGPSGGGKTHLVKAALEAAKVPWVDVNCTEYSDVGYAGRDLVSMYTGLIGPRWQGVRGVDEEIVSKRQAIENAQRFGVVVLDEWDKLRLVGKRNERDVGRALQSELLKLVEGSWVQVARHADDRQAFVLDTSGILHIAVGAFQGLAGVVADDRGWDADDPRVRTGHMEADVVHLCRYGFLEELVGRFSTIIAFPPLEVGPLAAILREQMLPWVAEQLADDGITLMVDDGGINMMAARATGSPIGARALLPLLESVMAPPWVEARSGDVIVLDAEGVQRGAAQLRKQAAA